MPDTPARKIDFEGLHNFRDFGGYPAGGKHMVAGRFFRSANHASPTDADLARLSSLGVGTVVDLRRPIERERQPSRRWPGFDGQVIENHDPAEGEETWDVFIQNWDMSYPTYRAYLTRYYERAPHLPRLIDLYTRYFDALATGDGGVLVHCAAGKDRTGLICALTHTLAGVHRDDIIADYLLTNDPARFEAFGATWAESIRAMHGRAPTLETMRMVMGVEAFYLERALEVIAERDGGIEHYLRDRLGVDAGKRKAIEKRLFE